ncbi:hypothetical protein SAMN05444365_102371 [Micromonospora pattaloongensis]|uniref:EcsC protein family protein n=1 Tax=Micromonospora pattaloongensis TaxID=405436 RepID=A0A1H3K6I0_9ACTN|nr:hypothetical protein [Micromonospora pattaloongensis]SDY47335.1 hypothetical protein SAMN05444365_102371 [Micromonospora pattaloongensis]
MTRFDHSPQNPPAGPPPSDDEPGADLVVADGELGRTVVELTRDDIEPAQRRRLLGRLIGQVRARGVRDLFKPKAALRWMADVVTEIAPHVPVRDLETLRRHYDGLEGDALAERLVRNAALATAGVGAAGGGVAAVEWAATPTLLSAPVLLAAETVVVVAIELKLIGELHEVYGAPVRGNGGQRAVSMLQSWAGQRGINPMVPGVGLGAVLGTAARNELRDMLLRRFGRNLTTLGPFLSGAAVASYLNRRATRSLGDRIRDDLRKRHGTVDPAAPPRVIEN